MYIGKIIIKLINGSEMIKNYFYICMLGVKEGKGWSRLNLLNKFKCCVYYILMNFKWVFVFYYGDDKVYVCFFYGNRKVNDEEYFCIMKIVLNLFKVYDGV